MLLVNKALQLLSICRVQLQVAPAFLLPSVLARPLLSDLLVSLFSPGVAPGSAFGLLQASWCLLLLQGGTQRLGSRGQACSVPTFLTTIFCSECQLTVTRLEKAKRAVSEEQLHLALCQPLQPGNLKLIKGNKREIIEVELEKSPKEVIVPYGSQFFPSVNCCHLSLRIGILLP